MRAGLATVLIALAAGAHAQTMDITIAVVPVTNGGAFYLAKEKGYFAQEGLNVTIEPIGTLAEAIPPLSAGRIQYGAGGLAPSIYNAMAQGLPVRIVASHGQAPLGHDFLLRPALKDAIKTPKDLKGRVISTPARSSIITYEVGKILQSAGLSLKDVEMKNVPFNQMAVAFQTGAIDAGIMVPPQTLATVEAGFAVSWINPEDYIKPQPMEIAITMINTDWAAKNPKQADGFMYALMRGTREYCDAYHRAANRAEVISHIVKYTTVKDPAAIDKYPWGSRNVRGQVAVESVMDIQDFYVAEAQSSKKLTLDQMVDMKYADAASSRLGPYAPPPTAKEPGCR